MIYKILIYHRQGSNRFGITNEIYIQWLFLSLTGIKWQKLIENKIKRHKTISSFFCCSILAAVALSNENITTQNRLIKLREAEPPTGLKRHEINMLEPLCLSPVSTSAVGVTGTKQSSKPSSAFWSLSGVFLKSWQKSRAKVWTRYATF